MENPAPLTPPDPLAHSRQAAEQSYQPATIALAQFTTSLEDFDGSVATFLATYSTNSKRQEALRTSQTAKAFKNSFAALQTTYLALTRALSSLENQVAQISRDAVARHRQRYHAEKWPHAAQRPEQKKSFAQTMRLIRERYYTEKAQWREDEFNLLAAFHVETASHEELLDCCKDSAGILRTYLSLLNSYIEHSIDAYAYYLAELDATTESTASNPQESDTPVFPSLVEGHAYVNGHGGDPGGPQVQVPPGRTVSFYADLEQTLLHRLPQGVLNAGDILPRQTYRGGEEIPNYIMSPLEDTLIAENMTAASSRLAGALYFVGKDWPLDQQWIRLCTMPQQCTTADEQYDPEQHGYHRPECQGLFRLLRERHLHLLCCRVRGERSTWLSTKEFDVRHIPVLNEQGEPVHDDEGRPLTQPDTVYGDTPTAYYDSLNAQARNILTWASQDREAAANYVHSLPTATLTALRAHTPLAEWLAFLADPLDTSNTAESSVAVHLYHKISKRLDNYLAKGNEEAARAWWWALPDQTRAAVQDFNLMQRYWSRLGISHAPMDSDSLSSRSRPRPAISAAAPAVVPADFVTAWADPSWRNAFIFWMLHTDTIDGPHRVLPTLYALLHPTPQSPSPHLDPAVAPSHTADVADLTDPELIDVADTVWQHCHFGVQGVRPAVPEHLVTELGAALTPLPDDTLREAGLDVTGRPHPDVVRPALQQLDAALTATLTACYQQYLATTPPPEESTD